MKVSLIVASGVHQGKPIPISGAKFVIGRDPQCQLRPASQAISKLHCGFFVREGKVFAMDFGSTNGTSVNDEQLPANLEREVKHGDRIKAGPLDFTLSLTSPKPSDSTPLPADLKAMGSSGAIKLKEAVQPKAAAKSGSEDDIAAMLLGMNEEDTPSGNFKSVPEGSTIMEMPNGLLDPNGEKKEEKKDEKKAAIPTKEGSSNAASELLRKYMKRPR